MKHYRVTWTVDVYAETPESAARDAYAMQTDKDTAATVYKAEDRETCEIVAVDLLTVKG